MFSTAGATYGCRLKSRVLEAQLGDSERHRFWVGSASPREENEIQLVEFNEEMQECVLCVQVYSHPGEVASLAPCPRDASTFMTSTTSGTAALWRAPGATDVADLDSSALPTPSTLELKASVSESGACSVVWQPTEAAAERVVTYRDALRVYDVGASALAEVCVVPVEHRADSSTTLSSPPPITSAAWDPHQSAMIGCAYS